MASTTPKRKVSFATPFLSDVTRSSNSAKVEIIHTTKNTRVVKPDYKSWIQNMTPLSKILDEHLKKKSDRQSVYTQHNSINEDFLGDSFLLPTSDVNGDKNSDKGKQIAKKNTRIKNENKSEKEVNRLSRQTHKQTSNKSFRRKKVLLRRFESMIL